MTGRVVDERQNAIAGAEVEAVLHHGVGSNATLVTTTSDGEGRFRL
jgi:hypothetical protein